MTIGFKNKETNEIIITSQNHSYAVNAETLPDNVKPTYINLNDQTIEGIQCDEYNVKTVQFHPELTAGPYDANKILTKWVEEIETSKVMIM